MKEQITQSMFDYLLKVANGQLQLTPDQLEKVTGISSKQQSVLRVNNEFPIKFSKIGKLVFYSINDVIDYLVTGNSQVEEKKKKDFVEAVVVAKNRKIVKNVSNIFMMKTFSSVLKEEGQQLFNLSYNIDKYTDSFSLYEKLNDKLSSKNTTTNIKEIIRKQ